MSRKQIFVDTSFVIALINERDQYYFAAQELVELYDEELLVTSEAVLFEVANALSRAYKKEAIKVIETLLESENVEVVRLTVELFNRAFVLYKKYEDKDWGLVDCLSFVIMEEKNVNEALTFDRHFSQAGFKVLTIK